MLSKKNIRPGNFKYNFFILIFFFVVFMFFEVKSNDNIDGSNIDLKTKHDILLEEADAILKGKSNMVYFIS